MSPTSEGSADLIPMKKNPARRSTSAAPEGRTKRARPATSADRRGSAQFPIVGIGASAGGLEAIESFLRNVPEKSGMAFVIVQHLDPTHTAMLAELLQRSTPMPVVQVRDRTRVRPDSVYVIPPNKDMSILHGMLHLLDPAAPRGLRLPIDFFLRSLAEDAQERSIGVILSGMGSDGTLGLQAIKYRAGASFVQDPASAKFDSMPRSAIEAGVADIVAPVEALPGRIAAYRSHAQMTAPPKLAVEDRSQSAFDKIVILLRSHTGQDFSLYKRNTVYRRIERRMGIHQIHRIAGYVRFLQENPQELDLLFQELLIGVTTFFRDPEAWTALHDTVIPALLKGRPVGQPVRAWVPGCSTGEEAYSLAMTFIEAQERPRSARSQTLQVFATDLDRAAIDKARGGVFPESIAADVSEERLDRFFARVERGYQVRDPVRESVIFATQNLVMDPPFTRLDLICCRNVLIYLVPEIQTKLIELFHFCLNPGGYLLLGSAESIGDHAKLFAPVPGKARLFQRREPRGRVDAFALPAAFGMMPSRRSAIKLSQPPVNLQARAERLILDRFAPAAVLVNDQGDILFVSGRTGRYLEPPAGKANWNVLAMAREGLREELTAAFRKASHGKRPTVRRSVTILGDRDRHRVEFTVQDVEDGDALRGLLMITFRDLLTPVDVPRAAGRSGTSRRTATLERDLGEARQELRTTREEMQSSQEELKSANEELQSTNEELQSANEELTTSKEEMQSMNEELQTLNHEMRAKVDGLSRLNSDLKNLLDGPETATIFLDSELRVRLFTAGTTRIFKLIAGDVGRPITDIASSIDYPGLAEDAREVLRTLAAHDETVTSRDGSFHEVRITPYRTLEDRIDGVVLRFFDVTISKQLEGRLRATQSGLERQLEAHDRLASDKGDPSTSSRGRSDRTQAD